MLWPRNRELVRRLRGYVGTLLFAVRWLAGLITRRLVTVRVFHNVATDDQGRHLGWEGYQYQDPVVEVWRLPVRVGDPLRICEEVFQLLNVGDDPNLGPPDVRAVSYRARGNRSLSVGDCLAIGNAFYAVAKAGFEAISPPVITTDGMPGSTPIWSPHPPSASRRSRPPFA